MGAPSAESCAKAVATQIADSRKPVVLTLRELRDGALNSARLSLKQRHELQRAFNDAGLRPSISFVDADLDQAIEVHRGRVGWPFRVQRWLARPLATGIRGMALLLGLAAALIALYPAIRADAPPRPMSGDVNLLVAEFANGAKDTPGVSESLAKAIGRATKPSPNPLAPEVRVRGPRQVGIVENPEEAARVAERHGAQVVIYGVRSRHGRQHYVQPFVRVDSRWLLGAEELGGAYPLPKIELGESSRGPSLPGRAELRQLIANHVDALTALMTGLGWFSAARWGEARRWFKRSSDLWPDDRHQAFVNLFLGNAAGKLGNLLDAKAAYLRAESSDPGLTRAHLGLTEVRLHGAMGGCDGPVDIDAVRAVAAEFASIRTNARGKSLPTTALRVRTSLGRARALLCLNLLGQLPGQPVLHAFRHVLSQGKSRQASFLPELAEARAGMALALINPTTSPRRAEPRYLKARTQYVKARGLSNDPARERTFTKLIVLIDTRLRSGAGTIWSRSEPPPPGVRTQVEYFGAGDSVCGPAESTQPEILTDRRPFYQFQIVEGADDPELGETLSLCPRGMDDTQPVALMVRGPGGFRIRKVLPASDDQNRYATFWLGTAWPTGEYTAIARQSDVSVRLAFDVVLPRHRGVRAPIFIARKRPEPLPLMVVGQRPDVDVTVDVYRIPGDPLDPRSYSPYRYATSFLLHTDNNGIAEARPPTRPSDEGRFVLRMRGIGSYKNQDLVATVSICDGGECR